MSSLHISANHEYHTMFNSLTKLSYANLTKEREYPPDQAWVPAVLQDTRPYSFVTATYKHQTPNSARPSRQIRDKGPRKINRSKNVQNQLLGSSAVLEAQSTRAEHAAERHKNERLQGDAVAQSTRKFFTCSERGISHMLQRIDELLIRQPLWEARAVKFTNQGALSFKTIQLPSI